MFYVSISRWWIIIEKRIPVIVNERLQTNHWHRRWEWKSMSRISIPAQSQYYSLYQQFWPVYCKRLATILRKKYDNPTHALLQHWQPAPLYQFCYVTDVTTDIYNLKSIPLLVWRHFSIYIFGYGSLLTWICLRIFSFSENFEIIDFCELTYLVLSILTSMIMVGINLL